MALTEFNALPFYRFLKGETNLKEFEKFIYKIYLIKKP